MGHLIFGVSSFVPNYRYTAIDEKGATVSGELKSANADAVVDQLLNMGVTPTDVQLSAGGQKSSGSPLDIELIPDWPKDDDLILFTRQMYTLTKSGVSLVRAFQGLSESTPNKKLCEAMAQIIEDLQSGRDLSAAMGEHSKIFNQLYLRIIRMGEETGRMDESFKQLYMYMEVDKETRKQIKSALRYPTFVIIAISIAMVIVNIYVIPSFKSMFAQFGSDLPMMTKVLLSTSDFTQKYIGYIILVVFFAVYSFKKYINSKSGRIWWDEKRLNFPIVGNIINRASLARYARAFSMGSRAGLPVIQTLSAVAEAVDNAFMEKKINAMRDGIERGESLTQSAYASGMFTPLVLQMMSVGEETGGMDEMMQEVAEFYEREVEYDVKGLSSAIEPILLTVIGGMVLVLALGIFMPMWSLGKAAMK
ncbi:MAG: type II secretion system F family protein [Magnetococcales bacterium]|nr:type II secretion system F family protein [Magnetococcales bacterium]